MVLEYSDSLGVSKADSFLEPSPCRNDLSYSQTRIHNPSAGVLFKAPYTALQTFEWKNQLKPIDLSGTVWCNVHVCAEILWLTSSCKRVYNLTCSPRTVVYNEGTLPLVKARVAILICVASSLRPASTWHSISALLRKYRQLFYLHLLLYKKNTSHNEGYL